MNPHITKQQGKKLTLSTINYINNLPLSKGNTFKTLQPFSSSIIGLNSRNHSISVLLAAH